MKQIFIESTSKTPSINLDPKKGLIEIKGRSIPENAGNFYRRFIFWLKDYSHNPQEKTKVNILLEYLNTDTHKYILDMLDEIKQIHLGGNEIEIKWFYEEYDEDIKGIGEEYAKITDLPFKFIKVEEMDFLK
ncbi:MAG: DUF1987 domain-containing protein [Bacteroidota bacterium]